VRGGLHSNHWRMVSAGCQWLSPRIAQCRISNQRPRTVEIQLAATSVDIFDLLALASVV
jgi:hypothetical protein